MNYLFVAAVFAIILQVHGLDVVETLFKRGVSFETTIIPNVLLPGERYGSFHVTPFQVWTNEFKYLAPQPDGSLTEIPVTPSKRYFKGNIDNDDEHTVVISVSEQGEVGGVAQYHDSTYVLSLKQDLKRGEKSISLEIPQDDMSAWKDKSFCGANHDHYTAPYAPDLTNVTVSTHHLKRQTIQNVVRAAIECDSTYWSRWNNYQTALDYTTDIYSVVSAAYTRDFNAQLRMDTFICSASAYSYGTATNTALTTLQSRWNANTYGTVTRDVTTLLLGANVGGLAYLSASCGSYAYGVCGMTFAAPSGTFDYMVVAHEIGHNIGTTHTHCYSPPVDFCYNTESGCYTGTMSVPSGGGSIMSYCHTRPGGMANIQLFFGAVGQFGTNSERVPARIRTYINSVSSASCIPPYTGGSGSVTTSPVTTSRLTTSPVTTSRLTTNSVTTSRLTTSPVTTSAVTTSRAAVTTSRVTTSVITSASVTSSSVTTSRASVTTSRVTTSAVTTSRASVTTSRADVTTSQVTTSPLTTRALTSSPLTTSPITSSPITTAPITSGDPAVATGDENQETGEGGDKLVENKSFIYGVAGAGAGVLTLSALAIVIGVTVRKRRRAAQNQLYNPSANEIGMTASNSPPTNPEYHRPQSSPRAPTPQVHSGYNRPFVPPANQHAPPPKPLPSAPAQITVGSKVMATFSGDGNQYQAVVKEVKNGKYLVAYPDYNDDTEWLPASAVRKI